MEELLAAATAAMNIPKDLVRRSAEARARAGGLAVEEVLAAWTGGEPTARAAAGPGAGAAPAASAAQARTSEESGTPVAPAERGEPVESVPGGPAVEVFGPTDEEPEEAQTETPEFGPTEPAPAGAIPRWLAAAFFLLPAFAVLYALFLPNGPRCGDAGALAVDPVSGIAVGCDGGAYGEEQLDFFSLGRSTYAQCTSCHGENGGGGGNFPAFIEGALLSTFPDGACEDQVEWVRLGTSGWPEPTYGATAKPVGGSGAVMPGFGSVLSEEGLRAVVLFERVQFGGLDLEATIADCGLEDATSDPATGE